MKPLVEFAVYDGDAVTIRSAKSVVFQANLLGKRSGYDFGLRERDLFKWKYIKEKVFSLTGSETLASEAEDCWYQPVGLWAAPPEGPLGIAAIIVNTISLLGLGQTVATSRKIDLIDVTLEWYRRYMPPLSKDNRVRIRRDISEPEGEAFKLMVLEEVSPLNFVDDDVFITLPYLSKAQREGKIPGTRLRLMTKPSNRGEREWDKDRINWLQIFALALWTRAHL